MNLCESAKIQLRINTQLALPTYVLAEHREQNIVTKEYSQIIYPWFSKNNNNKRKELKIEKKKRFKNLFGTCV